MSSEKENRSYKQINPIPALKYFVEVFWEHNNGSDSPNQLTIFPDSFFKLIIMLNDGKITAYLLTGLWTKEIEVSIPANTVVYGVKFKILAAEYLFQKEFASLLQTQVNLNVDFLNIKSVDFNDFDTFVNQMEAILVNLIKNSKKIESRKLQLSQMLYKMEGDISAEEVSNQIYWSNRQINRYLNKYLGVSLKKYINIQRCYSSYIQIIEGRFFPDNSFYDQAHFIREIKKYTGETPKTLHKHQNDRFVQLRGIIKK